MARHPLIALALALAAPVLGDECVELAVADRQCGAQGANLGTDFATPGECAAAAAANAACGDHVMWSDAYNHAWGCRCCADGGEDGGNANANWDLYEYSCAAPTAAPAREPTVDTCYDTTRGGCWTEGFVDYLSEARYCQMACQLEPGCEYFSWHPDRGDKRCHLCAHDADWSSDTDCTDSSRCFWGPRTCDGDEEETPAAMLTAAVAAGADVCAGNAGTDNLFETMKLNSVLKFCGRRRRAA